VGTAVKVAVTVQRVFSLIFVLVVVGIFTVVGFSQGGSNTWFIVGFAWLVGIMMVVGLVSPGRGRLRWSVLK
jgi:membrane protein YdbS with pleckstrin-like domain